LLFYNLGIASITWGRIQRVLLLYRLPPLLASYGLWLNGPSPYELDLSCIPIVAFDSFVLLTLPCKQNVVYPISVRFGTRTKMPLHSALRKFVYATQFIKIAYLSILRKFVKSNSNKKCIAYFCRLVNCEDSPSTFSVLTCPLRA